MQREKFQSIIEEAIAASPLLSESEAEALRSVGLTATRAVVGDFDGCPADKAGLYEPPASNAVWQFVRSFDPAMQAAGAYGFVRIED